VNCQRYRRGRNTFSSSVMCGPNSNTNTGPATAHRHPPPPPTGGAAPTPGTHTRHTPTGGTQNKTYGYIYVHYRHCYHRAMLYGQHPTRRRQRSTQHTTHYDTHQEQAQRTRQQRYSAVAMCGAGGAEATPAMRPSCVWGMGLYGYRRRSLYSAKLSQIIAMPPGDLRLRGLLFFVSLQTLFLSGRISYR
jgi:hypothetical protein